MPNDLFIRMNLVISVLTLVYLLMSYYGYVRFFNMCMKSCESYSKDYLKLPRVTSKSKVLVSLYAREFPEMLVKSILDQTVHPDQIIITSPAIPSFLSDNKILVVHSTPGNYESLTPLLSPLSREKDGEAKIIIVDSRQVYGKDFVETLVEASENSPDAVIFTKGYNAKKSFDKGEKVDVPYENDVIDVSGGVLIKPKFFGAEIFEIDGVSNAARKDLDVFLSSYLRKKSVSMVQIKYDENFHKIKTISDESLNLISYYAAFFPSFN